MSLKGFAAKIFASYIHQKNQKWIQDPVAVQDQVFKELIQKASTTQLGKDHNFSAIQSHEDFVNQVPIRDYEGLKCYVDQVVKGEENILWPGKPLYFAKTSGTTSGAKYIPLTKESIPYHIEAARNAILSYIHETGNTDFVDGKMIFLQGSPELTEKNGIKLGRLSGIVAHFVPKYLQKNRLSSWETNCIEDWETKVDAKDTAEVVDRIEYNLGGSYISKGDLVFMDLITQNAKTGWKRPIYFTSVSGYDFFDVNDYLQLEGLVYKFVPIKGGSNSRQPQRVADYKMYSNLVKSYKYYGMKEKKNFFLDDKAAYVPGDLQQMAMLLAKTYLNKIKTYEQYQAQVAKVGVAGAPVPSGFRSVEDYLAREKDSLGVYRSRAEEVLNHIFSR